MNYNTTINCAETDNELYQQVEHYITYYNRVEYTQKYAVIRKSLTGRPPSKGFKAVTSKGKIP